MSSTTSLTALLLVAHGSRRAESNDEVRALTDRLRERVGAQFEYVDCAFLELAEPTIPDGIEACISQGANEVIVLPYFLSAGRHVATDIPAEIQAKQDQYPSVRISITPYIGAAEEMVDILLKLAQQ